MHGNLNQWWKNESISRFKNATECVVNQYSNFRVYDKAINGLRTLGEPVSKHFLWIYCLDFYFNQGKTCADMCTKVALSFLFLFKVIVYQSNFCAKNDRILPSDFNSSKHL